MHIQTEDSINTDTLGTGAGQQNSFRQDHFKKSLKVLDNHSIALPSVKNRSNMPIRAGHNSNSTIELLGHNERHN